MSITRRSLLLNTTDKSRKQLVERLRWVIGLRWTVVLALIMVGIAGQTYRSASPELTAVHAGLAVLVLAYNLLFVWLYRRPDFGQTTLTRLVRYAQAPVDLLVLSVLLHFSGGITSPIFVLYFLYIFIGLAILPPAGAYWVAGLSTVAYGVVGIVELSGVRPLVNPVSARPVIGELSVQVFLSYFITVAATLLITAYIANYFAGLLTRDESTIRKQLQEINALYDATRTVATATTIDDVVRTLVATAADMATPTAAALVILTDARASVAATVGLPPDERDAFEASLNGPPGAEARNFLSDPKGIFAPEAADVPALKAIMIHPSIHSLYAVPMLADERVAGNLVLWYERHFLMPPNLRSVLVTITQQAALALERARLFSETERSAREMTGLYHIGLATTSSLQIDEVLRLIYEQVQRAVHPDTFYIGLYDEDRGEISFEIFVENGEFLPPFPVRLGGGVSAWVIRNSRPVFVRHWTAEIEQLPFEAGLVGVPTESLISVPLMAKNKMVGVMSVQAQEPGKFDQDHLRLLTSIAGQAALALENAKLHQQVFEQSQRDPLTGVFNHGTFIDKLQTIARQSTENQTSLALIMLDIDRFKQYNDTYGHMVGDDVLRSIVVAVQNHLKSTDVVGRWGGEEFGIVLPDINRSQARLVAERIRQTAARTTLKDIHGRTIPSPTVSQGVAMFPSDATNIEELIDKADSALYRAKDLGRNQIADWIDIEGDRGPLSFRQRG